MDLDEVLSGDNLNNAVQEKRKNIFQQEDDYREQNLKMAYSSCRSSRRKESVGTRIQRELLAQKEINKWVSAKVSSRSSVSSSD